MGRAGARGGRVGSRAGRKLGAIATGGPGMGRAGARGGRVGSRAGRKLGAIATGGPGMGRAGARGGRVGSRAGRKLGAIATGGPGMGRADARGGRVGLTDGGVLTAPSSRRRRPCGFGSGRGDGLVAVEVDAFRPGRPDMGGGGGGLLVREASGPLLALASGPPSDGLAVRLADPLGLQRRHPAQRRLPFLPHGGADLLGVVLADEPALSPVRNPDPAGPLLVVLGPALELPRVGRLPGPAGLRIDPADHDVHVRVIAVGMAGDESLAAGIAASVEGFEGGGHHLPLRRVLARRPRARPAAGDPGRGLRVRGRATGARTACGASGRWWPSRRRP